MEKEKGSLLHPVAYFLILTSKMKTPKNDTGDSELRLLTQTLIHKLVYATEDILKKDEELLKKYLTSGLRERIERLTPTR